MAFQGASERPASPTVVQEQYWLPDEGAEVEWLRRTLRHLRATISDAEQKQTKDEGLALWLQDMKDVAFDVEDVIDVFEYEDLRRQIEDGGSGGSSGSSRCSPPPSRMIIVHKIDHIRQRLENIARERNGLRFGDLSNWGDPDGRQRRMMQTSSLLKEGEVFGREEKKEEIIEFLLTSDDQIALSTIAITGMGGLGKTTLAQLVYNDKRVDEHFDLKVWVCATADYDVVNLTREILCTIDYDMRFSYGSGNLDVCQRQLMERLREKRFLLVIDNFWDRDHIKWLSLRAPLIYGEMGSKVLITTRDIKVSKILQTRKTVELGMLGHHDCWMLFKKHAFADGNSGEHPRLEAIGKQIVEKFKGVPLAAVAMGGLLQSESEESEWTRIAESETLELEHGESGIFTVLRLSYEHLLPQLKPCFAYCSLFPKNHEFRKLELVQQWMAQGFVQTGGKKRLEDVGNQYFDDLFSRSFFQLVDDRFVMHELIHDLALLISQRDHSVIDIDADGFLEKSPRLHHLSLVMASRQLDQRDLERLCRHRSLRTLVLCVPYGSRFQIPHRLFPSLNTLRVLDLSRGRIETLPESIGTLIHLRYLDLRWNDLRSLPESLCCLYKLQTLRLEGCCHTKSLPQGMRNLINLRHLEVAPFLLSQIVGFGKLTCLQELESFPISRGHGVKVEDLRDMNELRGSLSIQNLRHVRRKDEAALAMLNGKRHLHKLELEWERGVFKLEGEPSVFEIQCEQDASEVKGGESVSKIARLLDVLAERRNSRLEEEVLEALTPPANLKELAVKAYVGVRCPSWMENLQLISKLESLRLMSCINLSSLPLHWDLPLLGKIEIAGCPRLRSLPSLPTALRELTLRHVGLGELPEFFQRDQPCHRRRCGPIDAADLMSPSCSLSILRIEGCHALTSLRQGLLRHHLRNLTVLSIKSCRRLVHWPEGAGFQATLCSLQEELSIRDCPELTALPSGSSLSASLQRLTLVACPGVTKDTPQMGNFFFPGSIAHVREEDEEDMAAETTQGSDNGPLEPERCYEGQM